MLPCVQHAYITLDIIEKNIITISVFSLIIYNIFEFCKKYSIVYNKNDDFWLINELKVKIYSYYKKLNS